MKRSKLFKGLSVLLTLTLLFSTLAIAAYADYGFVALEDTYLISDTQRRIAPGVQENRIVTNDSTGQRQEMIYAVSVDPTAPVGLMAGYADYNTSGVWKMQTVREQAAKAQEKTGRNIVAAVNADIFNMSTGEPGGVLVMNGTVVKKGIGKPYFGVTKDGKVVLGGSLDEATLATLQEAVSGFYMLVKDGKREPIAQIKDDYVAPHTAVGVKANGTVVIVTVDGRNFPVSCSLDNYDLATIMLGLGCVDVLNLDGGGSSTYLAKYEGKDYLELANKPSDAVERKVSSSLFVYSTATPSGEFDHADLEPNNLVYTPGTTVSFTATGVDSSGMSAPLPENGRFELASDSAALGSVTDDGVFTSNGTVGAVTVNYVLNGETRGQTKIEIREPDEIYFSSEEVSLGFEKESTLGLTVKYAHRDVIYRPEDIVWSLSDPRLGHFDGLTFISSADDSVTGTITASYRGSGTVKGSIAVIVGKLPSVMMDFEDEKDAEGNVVTPAEDYWDFTRGTSQADGRLATVEDPNARLIGTTYNRGEVIGTSIVDISSGEPVRFGNHALKLHYDFSNSLDMTTGIAMGFTEATQKVEGSPTAIGMWVYCPEGTPNLWLRVRVEGGDGNVVNTNFTLECKQTNHEQLGGFDWQGWKYVEADLSAYAGPFSLIGGETVRIMRVPGNGNGLYTRGATKEDGTYDWIDVPKANCKGDVYVDNIQFVYGANTDDIDQPLINSITANREEIVNGMEINTSTISFRGVYSDVQNKYTTGVDPDTVAIFVDGVELTHADNCVLMAGDETIYLDDVVLPDGPHSVTLRIRDGFGNETVETRTFTVAADSDIVSASVAPELDAPILGRDYPLVLTATDLTKVAAADASVKIDSDFTDFDVVFADGFTGTYEFNARENVIALHADKTGEPAGNEIARIVFHIPRTLDRGKLFSYAVNKGELTYTESDDPNLVGGFTQKQQTVEVIAAYELAFEPVIVGRPATLTVTDLDGKPVEGAVIKRMDADAAELGATDANGKLVTDALSGSVQTFQLQAFVGDDISFKVSGQSTPAALNEDGKPVYILTNATRDPSTEKSLSWLSNYTATADKAIVRLAEKAAYDKDGEAAFTEIEGSTDLHQFLGSSNVENNYAVRISNAILTGLTPNVEYVYQVGDGELFSDVRTFKTKYQGFNTNFFVIGDSQATEADNLAAILGNLQNSGKTYDFGIQTGDSIEVASVYSDWKDVLDMYNNDYLSNVDVLHVLGNHEYMGDAKGENAVEIFNIPAEDHYSVTYGNVYAATISYTTDMNRFKADLEWLKSDAAASDAMWKILTVHQPAYYTNIDGGNEIINELLPPAAEEAGIDFVFSGHDHSYARTEPLKGGEVDEENGIVYFICGTTGAKSYQVHENPDFHFEIATQDFDGVYLTVEATDRTFSVSTHTLNGEQIDGYTKTKKNACATDGHTYTYDNGYLKCDVCGHAEAIGSYTGFAKDAATGRTRYFVNGAVQTGWLTYLEDVYYFDENGLAVSGKQSIKTDYSYNNQNFSQNITYTFDENGKQIGAAFVKLADGYTRAFRGGDYIVGWYDILGEKYFFSSNTRQRGRMFTGTRTIVIYTGQEITFKFAEDGHLLEGAFVKEDGGTCYYWGESRLLGWQEIKGSTYFFDYDTGYMVTGMRNIDGKNYLFSNEGKFYHEGNHEWKFDHHQDATCVDDEENVEICTKCGELRVEKLSGPTGHTDADGDDICDVCGKYVKASGFWEIIMRFFVKIRNWFRNFFSRLTD